MRLTSTMALRIQVATDVDRARYDVIEFLAAIAPLVYSDRRMPDINWTFQLAHCGVSKVKGERSSERHGKLTGELGTHPPIGVEMTTTAHQEGMDPQSEGVVYSIDNVRLGLLLK